MRRDRAPLLITTSLTAISVVGADTGRVIVARSISRSSTCVLPASAASSAGYSSGSVTSVRNPRLPKFTPRIGTFTPARPMQSAMLSSVPSPPSTSTRPTSDTSACLSAMRRAGFAGMSAAVAVSNTASTRCAPNHFSTSTRCGVAACSRDLATTPTRVMGGICGCDYLRSLRCRKNS